MSIVENYSKYLPAHYSNFPQGRFVSLLLVRKVESEAVFRTEGSGEPLNREFVFAGRASRTQDAVIPRIVISKRKQTAVERRTGREVLRRYDLLLKPQKSDAVCSLNTNNPCEKCIDCMVYGYAAGGGGAQRSRVITDDAFSLHSADVITGLRQFNALFDNSTMRNPETGKASTSIGTDEYVRPESLFLDIETLKDVTPDELRYALGNILRSARYGAISSRIGKVENILAGVFFSDCELFSNLELTQTVYDLLNDGSAPAFPTHPEDVVRQVQRAADGLRREVPGQIVALAPEEIAALRSEIVALYAEEQGLEAMLRRMTDGYGPKS
jgi:CRISPR-associated protein Csc2